MKVVEAVKSGQKWDIYFMVLLSVFTDGLEIHNEKKKVNQV